MKTKTRKIRRFVIEEDRFGDWKLVLYYNRGKRQLAAKSENYNQLLKVASEMPINQPEIGWKWHA